MSHARPLRTERDGAVASIVLLGPGRGNAMGPDFWTALPAAFDELEADDAVRAVVISGHGGHFSFGLDLAAMAAGGGLRPADSRVARHVLHALIERMQFAFERVARSRLPSVAAIAGWCIGSGLELACACDMRYAQNGAKFSLREVQLGIVADLGGLVRLPYLIGEGRARELAFTGADIDADEAAKIGLVNAAVPDVIAHAAGVAARIAALPAPAVRGVKRMMNARIEREIAAHLQSVAAWNAAFLALAGDGGGDATEV